MNAKASVAVLTVLLLAACGGQSAPASQSAAAKPASSSPAAAPSGTSGSAGASPQASGAAAAGCDDLVAAAKKEGALSLYGTPGTPYRQVSVVEFEKAFPGIKVDGAFIPPTDQQSRLNLERQAGKYLADVTQAPGGSQLVAYREAKWMAPLAPNFVLPEVTDTSKWFQNQLPWVDSGEPHLWMSPVGSVIPIVFVNKSVDASQFTSYKDLLDPKWKGKLASTDIRNPGPGVAPSRFIRKSPDLGPSFVKELFAPGAVKLSTDQRQLIDWVAQGTYPVGLFLDPGEVAIAIKQGLPITMVPPDQFKEGAASQCRQAVRELDPLARGPDHLAARGRRQLAAHRHPQGRRQPRLRHQIRRQLHQRWRGGHRQPVPHEPAEGFDFGLRAGSYGTTTTVPKNL